MFFVRQKKSTSYKLQFILGIVALLIIESSRAQNYSYGSPYHLNSFQTVLPDYQSIQESRLSNHRWFVSRYAALSMGNTFYPHANAFYFSAPMGLQLNRSLNKNWYAFAGAYVAPTYTSFNHSMMYAPYSKGFTGSAYPPNYFTVNPGVQAGLMYISNDGSFSVSGSIRAEYHSYPVYRPAPTRKPMR
ncbi:MAG: hypothetical protein C5B52_19635 [Bacteroidetes bacterium]|nr:MAG: hypothetical protein C5B52_19635 [Bacteroidota bacterium]